VYKVDQLLSLDGFQQKSRVTPAFSNIHSLLFVRTVVTRGT